MEIDLLRIIITLLLIFFLPGFFLIQALFPRKNELDEEDDLLYRIALGIALSIVITTLDGFILGSLGVNPSTGKGYWDTPYIFGSLIGISLILFGIGWYRGAYPLLSRKKMETKNLDIPKQDKDKFYDLMAQWKKLYRQLEKYNELLLDGDIVNYKDYETKVADIKKRLKNIESKLIKQGHKEIPIIKAKETNKNKIKLKK